MKVKKLDELCDFISGLWTGKKPPYLSVGVIRNTNFHKNGNLDFSDIAQLQVEAKQFSTRQLRFGDIVLEKSGGGPKQPVGRVCVFEKDEGLFSLSNFTSAIRVKNADELYYKYLHYFLKHLYITGATEKIQTNSTGIRNLQLSLYKEFLVPLPSIRIQQAIVAKLDAIFVEIDKATAAAEANAKNAEELFESVLRQAYQIKDGLNTVELGNICDITGGGTPSKSNPNFYIGDIPWATVRDMNKDYLEETDFKINKEAVKESSTNIIPKNNVVIATRVGLGKVCILKQDTAINQDLRGVVPKNPKALDVNYLFFWFKSIRKVIVDAGRGATVHGVTLPFIKSLQIPLPPIALQEEIVDKLDAISEEVKKSSKSYIDKISELVMLKQAILKQAFNGELVKE